MGQRSQDLEHHDRGSTARLRRAQAAHARKCKRRDLHYKDVSLCFLFLFSSFCPSCRLHYRLMQVLSAHVFSTLLLGVLVLGDANEACMCIVVRPESLIIRYSSIQ